MTIGSCIASSGCYYLRLLSVCLPVNNTVFALLVVMAVIKPFTRHPKTRKAQNPQYPALQNPKTQTSQVPLAFPWPWPSAVLPWVVPRRPGPDRTCWSLNSWGLGDVKLTTSLGAVSGSRNLTPPASQKGIPQNEEPSGKVGLRILTP